MRQLVTRVDDELVEQIDALVSEGVVDSRSDAARQALRALVDRHRRRRIAEADIAAYSAQPQTEEELSGVDEAARRMIEEETW
ncbi:MAG: ribbon-helix-helix protein, CopG family [Actinobacteria bacterium]|nr:ribbon-helix-helix protein, CopG family [Actinomycetota bacterium]